eukprot:CAMPEP_0181191670 /NCGR_PEP_ID=MMETSP1096-20121128/12859_1 /TAXON_ID=156174 ORGANISM="Chrysochromulina ericina, Strain CCMP281" /NCGR_SAMPLE_ID=MMETSP1096 /ASSEMBLY_ACC=CAM_ASM_000453 /LENGTH=90 /DNA_ID=CAMNT_0023280985 /DNA_START=384 /DNA_END=656 /DNA_ORIENTATION=-
MAQGKPPVLSKVYLLGYLSPPMIKEMQDVAALAGCAALDRCSRASERSRASHSSLTGRGPLVETGSLLTTQGDSCLRAARVQPFKCRDGS